MPPNRRVFSEEDLEQLSDMLQRKLDQNRGHACVFSERSANALVEFAQQIEDPEVRQGIISMSKAWNETGISIRRWLVKTVLWSTFVIVMFFAWIKYAGKGGH